MKNCSFVLAEKVLDPGSVKPGFVQVEMPTYLWLLYPAPTLQRTQSTSTRVARTVQFSGAGSDGDMQQTPVFTQQNDYAAA